MLDGDTLRFELVACSSLIDEASLSKNRSALSVWMSSATHPLSELIQAEQ
jgi:hypothetical protein